MSHRSPTLPREFELLDEEPLRNPVLILAYCGWSDGGEAASTAIRYLCEQFQPEPYARLDCEEYFDFTVVRPRVRTGEDGSREIEWPDQRFLLHRAEHPDLPDLVFSLSEEPHLRWRRFTDSIACFAHSIGAERVISLGAYLADVIYSQPTRVTMTASDAEWIRRYELRAPRYEGATGVLTVLAEALRRHSVPSATLWAPIPHYVASRPNPRAALALLERVEAVTGCELGLETLCERACEFDDEISQLIAEDPELAAYVRELKRRAFSR